MGLALSYKSASEWPNMMSRPKTVNVSRRPRTQLSEKKGKKILRVLGVSLKKNIKKTTTNMLLFHQDPSTMDEEILTIHERIPFSEAIAQIKIHSHWP